MPTTNASKNALHKVLVIEDEGDMCILLNILLESKNVKVSHVKTLLDAMLFLKEEQPSLILLDNRLPDGYGIDFIAFLKANYPSIRIIMISGVDAAAEDVALEAGADTFLAKPFTKQKLHHSINTLLN
ncbi:response regulator receiver protein [Russula earlei]|uniref:Response regulator receiver protein n=1 Tax=Russula earlei TaxID=71964 RepID=A0ACC0TQK6_9AGAM|nr:response regulator receiver protein [Russula earlei]